ncbi:hypothetical protein ACFTAO_04440 [Paenibacillus rhizoplanae]
MESSVAQMNEIADAVSQSMGTVEELNRKNEGIFHLVGGHPEHLGADPSAGDQCRH